MYDPSQGGFVAAPQPYGACTHTYTTVQEEDLYPNIDIRVVDGFYVAVKKLKDAEITITLPTTRLGEDPYFYALRLSSEQLEAGRKIFYDRWNFVTGSDDDQRLYEVCEDELKHRRENTHSLHTHQMPSHTHSMGVSANGIPNTYSVGGGYHSHGPIAHTHHVHDHSAWMKNDPVWDIPAE